MQLVIGQLIESEFAKKSLIGYSLVAENTSFVKVVVAPTTSLSTFVQSVIPGPVENVKDCEWLIKFPELPASH